ncbi:hypothetical protein ACFVXW_34685 [Streptomyces sp. NPDC058251]
MYVKHVSVVAIACGALRAGKAVLVEKPLDIGRPPERVHRSGSLKAGTSAGVKESCGRA